MYVYIYVSLAGIRDVHFCCRLRENRNGVYRFLPVECQGVLVQGKGYINLLYEYNSILLFLIWLNNNIIVT